MAKYIKTKQDAEKALERNKPRLFFPILNTVFAGIFLGIYIYLLIVTELRWWSVFIIVPMIGFFLLSTWYINYFSKKKKSKQIYNFQEETELLVKYVKVIKNYRCYDVEPNVHFRFTKVGDEYMSDNIPEFDYKTREFITNFENIAQIHIGVNSAGLAVDVPTKNILGVYGMSPCSIWLKRKLKVPTAVKAKLNVDFIKYKVEKNTLFKYMRHEDTFYDQKTGWLCFGKRKSNALCTAYEIAPNTIVVLYGDDLYAVYVKIAPNLSID